MPEPAAVALIGGLLVAAVGLIAIGFAIALAWDRWVEPPASSFVETNAGSRMRFAMSMAWIAAVGGVWFKLHVFRATRAIVENAEPTALLWEVGLTLVMFIWIGAKYGAAGLRRARDAGRSRATALWLLLPLAAVYLIWLKPVASPARPAYRPSAPTARVALAATFGFAVLFVGAIAERVLELATENILETAQAPGVVTRDPS